MLEIREPWRVFLDGISVNQSLDMLIDSPDAHLANQRRLSPRSYAVAFRRLILAFTTADTVVVDKNIVASGGHSEKRSRLLFDKMNDAAPGILDTSEIPSPAALLQDASALQRIEGYVARAAETIEATAAEDWATHISRDCAAYLGSAASLGDDSIAPDLYEFKKDFFVTRQQYETVRPVLEAIPTAAIEELVRSCKSRSPIAASGACDRALREFCKRNVFAHFLIAENARRNADKAALEDGSALPDLWFAATREGVFESPDVTLGSASTRTSEDTSRKVEPVVAPYFSLQVLRILDRSDDPIEALPDAIASVRGDRHCRAVASLVKTVRMGGTVRDQKRLTEVAEDLAKEGIVSGGIRLGFTYTPLTNEVGFDLEAAAETVVSAAQAVSRRVRRRHLWHARKLKAQFGDIQSARDEEARLLTKLFPNTFGEVS